MTHDIELRSGRGIRLSTEQPRVWVVLDFTPNPNNGVVVAVVAQLEQAWHVAEAHIEDNYPGSSPAHISMNIQEWQATECLNDLRYRAEGWVRESWQTPT